MKSAYGSGFCTFDKVATTSSSTTSSSDVRNDPDKGPDGTTVKDGTTEKEIATTLSSTTSSSENGGAEVSCVGCCYTHWRFTPVKVRAGTLSAGVSISELSLYNEDQRVDQSKISSFSTDGTELPGAEPARAFDSNAGSQWKNDELVPLVFSFDGAVAATKFTLTTSTLSSSEDPVRWQLHASEDKVRGF